MPKRYIVMPEEVQLLDPVSGAPLLSPSGEQEVFSLGRLLTKIQLNPKWAENYASLESLDAICQAWEWSAERRLGVIELAESDWLSLCEAVENPRIVVTGPSGSHVQLGFGLHPFIARQILPILRAILRAGTDRPASLIQQVSA